MGNLHVINGSKKTATENHMIPGKTPEKQQRFKFLCVRKVLLMLTQGPGQDRAASQGPHGRGHQHFVLTGDLNLVHKHFVKGLLQHDELRKLRCLSANQAVDLAQPKDWVITNMLLAELAGTALMMSYDRQHVVVVGEWTVEPTLAPVQLPTDVDPALLSRMQQLRERLLERKHARLQQQEDEDRSEQMSAAEAEEEEEEEAAKRRRTQQAGPT